MNQSGVIVLTKKKTLVDRLKSRTTRNHSSSIDEILGTNSIISEIISEFDQTINQIMIELLDTGDMLFLRLRIRDTVDNPDLVSQDLFRENELTARIRYTAENFGKWWLEFNNSNLLMEFNLPENYFTDWARQRFRQDFAARLKESAFGRIFIFRQSGSEGPLPFTIVKPDPSWLQNLLRSINGETSQ